MTIDNWPLSIVLDVRTQISDSRAPEPRKITPAGPPIDQRTAPLPAPCPLPDARGRRRRPSLGTRHALMRRAGRDLAPGDRDETALDLREQARCQRAVVAALGVDGAQVRPGPGEAVALGQHDPRAFGVELSIGVQI